jgi:type IV pilus assembly protein PilA
MRNNKGFSLVELVVVVAIMAVLMAVLVPTLIRNVEKTRVQKDKSAIAEIHHSTELAIADEEYINATVSTTGTSVSNGVITVADLFANKDDDAEKDGDQLAAEVVDAVGATIKLTSKMKNDCTVKIVYMDTASGKVVLEVESKASNGGTGETFYIDSIGENKGTWPGLDATSGS